MPVAWVFISLGILYCAIILYFYIGLFRIKSVNQKNRLTVSVLVPARNEARNIEACLESLRNQTYPNDRFEVVVIDDHSTDETAQVVEKFISDKPNFRLLHHRNNGSQPTYKKQALNFAIQSVSSEIVMTIDADTIAQPFWVESMISQYDSRTGMVAGLVTFAREMEESLFHKMQTLEFAGIVFCGVGGVGNKNPLICNGSNLSYRMQAFRDAGGYEGNLHLPSGDDDLLLQNIHKNTDWKVRYSVAYETVNYTRPAKHLKSFLNQRARWASKSLHYPSKMLFPVLFSIYLYYALIFILLPFTVAGLFPVKFYLAGLLLKIVPEFLVMVKSMAVLRRRNLLLLFPLAQFFQVPYILYAGLMGFLNKFSWKDPNGDNA